MFSVSLRVFVSSSQPVSLPKPSSAAFHKIQVLAICSHRDWQAPLHPLLLDHLDSRAQDPAPFVYYICSILLYRCAKLLAWVFSECRVIWFGNHSTQATSSGLYASLLITAMGGKS